jgi:hypothetical protein
MGSLTYTTTTVPLSDDFEFQGQYDWPSLQMQKTYSVTGALIVQTGQKQTGRMVVLRGDDQHAWVTRADLATLRTLAATPGAVLTLLFRGITYSVMFDIEAGAIEAVPVADFDTEEPTDFFVVTLRFFVV